MITIAAFLISISVMSIVGAVGVARESATKSTIRKIDALLTKRIEGMERYFKAQEEAAVGGVPSYVSTAGYRSLWGTERERARVLGRKWMFRKHFPMSGSEAGDSRLPTNASNAEALYWFLIEGDSFGVAPVETDAFSLNEKADTDGDGLPEFIDGWGNPIVWYRWPTRLLRPATTSGDVSARQTVEDVSSDPKFKFAIDLQYANAGLWPGLPTYTPRGSGTLLDEELNDPLARDPVDPIGVTSQSTPTGAQQFEAQWHTPDTFHLPLIVSAGADGELGLFEPTDRGRHGHLAQPNPDQVEALYDNITNRNSQTGGR